MSGCVLTTSGVFFHVSTWKRAGGQERHLFLDEGREREAGRLDLGARQLNAEADAQSVAAGGVEREVPHRREVEPPRPALHVAPVASDVEHVDEGERRDRFDRLGQRLLAAPYGQGGTVLLPRVANQAEA